MWERIRYNPALVVAVVVAALNLAWDLSQEHVATITMVVETIVLIVAGIITRSLVFPMTKVNDGIPPPVERG